MEQFLWANTNEIIQLAFDNLLVKWLHSYQTNIVWMENRFSKKMSEFKSLVYGTQIDNPNKHWNKISMKIERLKSTLVNHLMDIQIFYAHEHEFTRLNTVNLLKCFIIIIIIQVRLYNKIKIKIKNKCLYCRYVHIGIIPMKMRYKPQTNKWNHIFFRTNFNKFFPQKSTLFHHYRWIIHAELVSLFFVSAGNDGGNWLGKCIWRSRKNFKATPALQPKASHRC